MKSATKDVNTKKDASQAKNDKSIHKALNEPKQGSLKKVLGNIKSNGDTPSIKNIGTEFNGMDEVDRNSALMELQKIHGNQYVQKVAGIQAKLKVSQPGDIYEQEADRVAEQVIRMPEPKIQRKCPGDKNCPLEDEEKKKKGIVQLKTDQSGGGEISAPDNLLSNLGSGQPLDKKTRAFMEPRFGHDFSHVRVHTDAKAAESAKAINAKAFTLGQNMVFGTGQYAPMSNVGGLLLAHELMHTIQQKNNLNLDVDTIHRFPTGQITTTSFEKSMFPHLEDRELVQYAIKYNNVGAINHIVNYQVASLEERYKLIDILVNQWWVGPYDEITLLRIWKSFGYKIIEAASTEQGLELWKKSVEKGARLDSIEFVQEFISNFEITADKVVRNCLEESKNRVESIRKRYGITEKQVQETSIVTTGSDKGQIWRRETQTYTKYEMPETQESKNLAKAASELLKKRLDINKLINEQNKYVIMEPHTFKEKNISDTYYVRKITDEKAYNALNDRIRDAKIEYNKFLNEKAAEFPILLPLATGEDMRLGNIAKGQPNQIAQIIGPMMKEVIENIQTSRKGLDDKKLSIWHLAPVLAKTKIKKNIKPGLFDILVDQKKAQVEEDEILIKTTLGILAGVLAIIAAIPSGGSSLMLMGSSVALGGSIGISAGLLTYEIEQYNLQKAAGGSDFVKAKSISNEEPSLFWLAIDIISFGLDIFGAAKLFKSLAKTAKIATLEVKAGGEITEAMVKNADEAVETLRKNGNEIAEGLGDRLAKDAKEIKSQKVPDAEKAVTKSEQVVKPTEPVTPPKVREPTPKEPPKPVLEEPKLTPKELPKPATETTLQERMAKLEEELKHNQAKTKELEKIRNKENKAMKEFSDQAFKTKDPKQKEELYKKAREAKNRMEAADKELEKIPSEDSIRKDIDRVKKEIGQINFQERAYEDSGKIDPCFPPGTLVKTPRGDLKIEELVEGELIYSYDFYSKKVIIRRIIKIFKNWTEYLVDINMENETVVATRMHHFWVNSKSWIPARDLYPNMKLQSINNKLIRIKTVNIISSTTPTYNLEVDESHNYFVGKKGILVHNASEYESTLRKITRIYEVVDTRTNTVIYVGKTYQGGFGDVLERFKQHLGKKIDWKNIREFIQPRMIKEGNWTEYETKVWEQHFIDKNGGLKSKNPKSQLRNEINAITKDKYDEYKKPKYGHNPCQ